MGAAMGWDFALIYVVMMLRNFSGRGLSTNWMQHQGAVVVIVLHTTISFRSLLSNFQYPHSSNWLRRLSVVTGQSFAFPKRIKCNTC